MEQHPIPRNISSFQFHLIGDMTVRQFGYLVSGFIIGFILYKTLPLPPLLSYPIIGAVVLSGFAFAFLPIQERPLDKWIVAFIKSILSPTQYLWQKVEDMPDILAYAYNAQKKVLPQNHQEAHIDAKKKLENYLQSIPVQPHQQINTREKRYVDQTMQLFATTAGPIPAGFQPVTPQPAIILPPKLTATFQPQIKPVISVAPLKPPVASLKQAPPPPPAQTSVPAIKPVSLPVSQPPAEEDKMKNLREEKEKLEEELKKLKDELAKTSAVTIIKPKEEKETAKPTIKTVTPRSAVNEIGIPKLPQAPNIIMGVIKDSSKKLLPNIILTIKDTKGNPHRALKTNRLGQFSTATPLQNGTYYVEAEDPLKRYTFDIAEINLEGKIFLPIEISAKGEKEQIREQLNKELFSNPGI